MPARMGATIGSTREGGRWKGVALVLLVVALAAGGWWALRTGEAPAIEVETRYPALGREALVIARFSAPGGLGAMRLELSQGDRTEVLAEERFPAPPPFGAEPVDSAILDVDAGFGSQPWLTEGEAVLRAVGRPWGGPLRSPDEVVVERPIEVRRSPPRLEVVSARPVVRQGGSGLLLIRVGPHHLASGVRAGDTEFPSFPHPSGPPDVRYVLFGVPWDHDDTGEVRVWATNDAGMRVEAPALRRLAQSASTTDTIRLDDAFLERVVPPIASRRSDLPEGSPLETYLAINGDLRAENLERIRELASVTAPELLFEGAFLQLPNSVVLAGFADDRTYLYDGEAVDRQVHLGLDLASVARAPVPAPNHGRVILADWLGIYGNAVLLDHGGGLMSLSGHLSRIDVAEGQKVTKGETIGASGQTGLAGGDHLHLEVLVHGTSVDPIEWLDGRWIETHVLEPMQLE